MSLSENLSSSQIFLAAKNGFITERVEVIPSVFAPELPLLGDHVLIDGELGTAQMCFDADVHFKSVNPIDLSPDQERLVRPTLEDSRSLRKRIV